MHKFYTISENVSDVFEYFDKMLNFGENDPSKVKSKSKNLEFLTTKVIVRIFSLKIRFGDSWGGGGWG